MKNADIARSFKLLADLMELHGENKFRTKAYRNAYNALRKFDRPLGEMSGEEIAEIPGVGKSTAEKIGELVEHGKMERLESYRDKTPEGIQELLTIRGLGPAKIKSLWDGLGVESPGELLYACNENRLIELSGFGLKTQADIKSKLEYHLESRDKRLYAAIEDNVVAILDHLGQSMPGVQLATVGEVARYCPVVHQIEILIGRDISSNDLNGNSDIEILSDEAPWTCRYTDGTPFTLHTCSNERFSSRKFELTGSESFISALNGGTLEGSDEEIFERAGKPYVIPEMREDPGLFETEVPPADAIIELEDIRGIVHNHSTYSDGLHSLREMSEHVQALGYEYFGISDHSQTAVYAGGLKPEEVLQQFDEVDALNAELAPFRVFKGIESDILTDGRLDYEDDLLARFDFVVASVHSGLKMDEQKATSRLIKAVEHPATKILGHPTGRLLLSRKGYPIDHMMVIDACAANGVAIELNANPLRLDVDYTWIPYAMEKGVWISINPDAHSMGGVENVRFGVYAARKGGLLKSLCLNALNVKDFEAWISK